MTRPTHQLADGSVVYPDGYDPADLTPLPEGYWGEVDFAKAKADLWSRVKARRSAEIDAGVTVPDIGAFDSDAAARENVSGAATAAMAARAAGASFAVEWTLLDNNRVLLDADQIIAVHLAGVERINAIHAWAAGLREAIDAAEDEAALDEIDIGEGWP